MVSETSHRSDEACERTASPALTILRVTSGNFLEMFDFFLFGFFAKAIGDAFFPVHDEVGRLLLTFVTFGAGFLMRPLGAILLGAYVDRVGRRKGLIVTLSIMAIGTVLIAITPELPAARERLADPGLRGAADRPVRDGSRRAFRPASNSAASRSTSPRWRRPTGAASIRAGSRAASRWPSWSRPCSARC